MKANFEGVLSDFKTKYLHFFWSNIIDDLTSDFQTSPVPIHGVWRNDISCFDFDQMMSKCYLALERLFWFNVHIFNKDLTSVCLFHASVRLFLLEI